jgi:hypothetical protein
MAVQPQVSAGGSRQRLLLLLLAAVAAIGILLLVAGPSLLGSQATEPEPATRAGSAPETTAPPQLVGPSTTLAPGGSGTVAATKDPFRPLVAPATAGSAAAAADPAATAATGPSAQTTASGAGQGGASVAGGGATAAENKVTLLGIVSESGARAARVEVDGTRYTVAEGESFAGHYRAVDIGSSCATFESGTTPFTLCEGEAVLK